MTAGQPFEVLNAGGKGRIEIPVREACVAEVEATLYLDGLRRRVRPAMLQGYVERKQATEHGEMARTDAVINQLPAAAVIEQTRVRLTETPIEAHSILSDTTVFSRMHLYYRPVYAFEFSWTVKEGRIGVIEIDGLSGEVIENGEWLRDKIGSVLNRDTLFDLGADVAGSVLPGGGIVVKVIGKLTS